jgi:hypothetical protein
MKGILFTEPLFAAVIDGTKTQTRRIIKPQPDDSGLWNDSKFPRSIDSDLNGFNGTVSETGESIEFKPRYKVGETVYLKEPYFIDIKFDVAYKFKPHNLLIPIPLDKIKWKNKLFMPRIYARYFIEITAVHCEKLQDISDDDCLKEGIFCFTDKFVYDHPNDDSRMIYDSPQEAYAALIDKINGKGTWESNPFVWVYEFKLINKKNDTTVGA